MKKKVFWVLLWVMVLVGGLLISNHCFQRSPVVPDVNAQGFAGGYNYLGGSVGTQLSYGFGHPTDLMPTLFTCSGCAETQSTCSWNCGATFNNCSSGGGSSGSSSGGSRSGQGSIFGGNTYSTCSGSLFGSCGGGVNTLMTCSGSLFGSCGGGVNTLMTCNMQGFGTYTGKYEAIVTVMSRDPRNYTMGECGTTMSGFCPVYGSKGGGGIGYTMSGGCGGTMGGCGMTMGIQCGVVGTSMGFCPYYGSAGGYTGGLGLMSNSAASPGF